jgi:hypothetical protein
MSEGAMMQWAEWIAAVIFVLWLSKRTWQYARQWRYAVHRSRQLYFIGCAWVMVIGYGVHGYFSK